MDDSDPCYASDAHRSLQMVTRPAALAIPARFPLWCEALHGLASRTRRDLMADLQALTPVVDKLGGSEAVGETVRAIQDVGRWWP